MKRYLMMSLLLLGLSQTGAQAQGSYDDDIYYNSSDIEAQKKADKNGEQERQNIADYSDSRNNRDNGDYENQGRNYESDGDYMGDDYNYATRFRRFNQPFYNMGYWSPYYNPYWYDPFWSDPYWGYSPWYRPGFSISFGMGPYWSSGWGWNNWWGYSPFNSYWNYPYYGNWYGGYYGGYWNGYYDGLYTGGGSIASVRNVNYGPRRSANSASNMGLRAAQQTVGVRRPQAINQTVVNSPRPQQQRLESGNVRNDVRTAEGGRTITNEQMAERPRRGSFTRDGAELRNENSVIQDRGRMQESRPSYSDSQPRYQSSPRFESSPRNEAPQRQGRVEMQQRSEPRYQQSAPRMESSPRFEQRSQPTYSAPRMSSPAPRMSSPSPAPMRSGGSFGGGRSMGGGRR